MRPSRLRSWTFDARNRKLAMSPNVPTFFAVVFGSDGGAGIFKEIKPYRSFNVCSSRIRWVHKDLNQQDRLRVMTLQEVFKMIEIEAECVGIGLAHERSKSELDGRSDGGDPSDARR